MIDEDIIAQFGFIELDDYIGDPGDAERERVGRSPSGRVDRGREQRRQNGRRVQSERDPWAGAGS